MAIIESPERLREKCAQRKARNAVGRPKGGNLQIKAFNDAVERGDVGQAYDELVNVAKDSDHKHWASAQKMLLDRTAHISHFEKAGSGGKGGVRIEISGMNVKVQEDIDDAEYEVVDG